MRTLTIIILLTFINSYGQAQNKASTKDQSKTIEINNDNGELLISFINGEIVEFVVNDEDVDQGRYDEYQEIIDEFTKEDMQEPLPPTPGYDGNEGEELRSMVVGFLMNNNIINSSNKYKVELKKNFLKVDGRKQSEKIHLACIDLFSEVYGHNISSGTDVNFKKSKNRSSTSISISDH